MHNADAVTYAELLAQLIPARRFGVVLGLERMRAILDRLGSPERRLGAVVHVGGTNGKGSTVAMVAALAAAAGRRVACYTSPHLSCLRERIAIDGAMISEPAIVAAAERVRAAGGDQLTFFEQITAIAMLAIAEASVDITVLEVGLGGRLDATNVIDPAVTVITGVALDHEAILGDTVERIAAEKAGIWKPGRPAIVGASGLPEAVPMLLEAARAAGAVPQRIDAAAIAAVPALALAGEHQRRNAAAAIAAVRALGLPIAASALVRVRHPGRFEIIEPPATPPGVPRIILDGAHNPHGAAALADALRARGERPVLIAAVSADKDVAAIARALAPAVRAVVATRYQQERAMDPARLAAAFAEALCINSAAAPAAMDDASAVVASASDPTAPHSARAGVASASDSLPPHGARAGVVSVPDSGLTHDATAVFASASDPIPSHGARAGVASVSDSGLTHDASAVAASVARSSGPALSDAMATAPDLAAAIAIAATHGAPIVIAGSLFLVGEARSLLLGAPTDPVIISDPPAAPLAR